MRKITGKILAAILAIMMVASMCTVAYASSMGTNTTDYGLRFDSDGKFRVLQITDMEAGGALGSKTKELISLAIKRYSPNLILLTGDNSSGTKGGTKYVQYLASLQEVFGNVKIAVTFGETDNMYGSDYNRQTQYDVLKEAGIMVDFDNNFSNIDLVGVGTGCIPIQNQTGTGVAWNLVLLDSGVAQGTEGYGKPGYSDVAPYVNEQGYSDVVKWFESMNTSVADYTADKQLAPTLCFQHIPLQEFYSSGIIAQCDRNDSGAIKAAANTGHTDGDYYYRANSDNETVTGSYSTACKCSASSTIELYKAFAAEGNVKGVFYGHDETNTIVGEGTVVADARAYSLVQGYTPTAKNDVDDPGLRLFELYEDGTYDTEIVRYKTIKEQQSTDRLFHMDSASGAVKYISEIVTTYANNKTACENNLLRNGFTMYDYDLNRGSGSQDYIYMGYKTTDDKTKAITGIRFQIGGKGTSPQNSIKSKVNGVECEFVPVREAGSTSVGDLNKGIGGKYVFMYVTRDPSQTPITNILINSTEKQAGYKDATRFDDVNKTGELNAGVSDADYIYVHYKTTGINVQYEHDKLASLVSEMNKLVQSGADVYTSETIEALRAKVEEGQVILDSYKASPYNYEYGKADIYAALKAIREARNNLSVHVYFDANGGNIDVEYILVPIGVQRSYSLKLSDFVPTGDSALGEFLGWSTSKNSESGYKDVIQILGNTTLYAIWSGEPTSGGQDSEIVVDTETETETETESDIVVDQELYGDVNCDGNVNMMDVTSLQKILALLSTHESYGAMSIINSDCNGDGDINMVDVTQIQKYLAKLVSALGPALG